MACKCTFPKWNCTEDQHWIKLFDKFLWGTWPNFFVVVHLFFHTLPTTGVPVLLEFGISFRIFRGYWSTQQMDATGELPGEQSQNVGKFHKVTTLMSFGDRGFASKWVPAHCRGKTVVLWPLLKDFRHWGSRKKPESATCFGIEMLFGLSHKERFPNPVIMFLWLSLGYPAVMHLPEMRWTSSESGNWSQETWNSFFCVSYKTLWILSPCLKKQAGAMKYTGGLHYALSLSGHLRGVSFFWLLHVMFFCLIGEACYMTVCKHTYLGCR